MQNPIVTHKFIYLFSSHEYCDNELKKKIKFYQLNVDGFDIQHHDLENNIIN